MASGQLAFPLVLVSTEHTLVWNAFVSCHPSSTGEGEEVLNLSGVPQVVNTAWEGQLPYNHIHSPVCELQCV